MKSFKSTIHIEYNWHRSDGGDIPQSHIEALEESAKDRIFGMINDGFTSGELCDNITMVEEPDEGTDYSGYWFVE